MHKYNVNDILYLIKGEYKITGDVEDRHFSYLKSIFEGDSDSLVFIDKDRKDNIAAVLCCSFSFFSSSANFRARFLASASTNCFLSSGCSCRL